MKKFRRNPFDSYTSSKLISLQSICSVTHNKKMLLSYAVRNQLCRYSTIHRQISTYLNAKRTSTTEILPEEASSFTQIERNKRDIELNDQSSEEQRPLPMSEPHMLALPHPLPIAAGSLFSAYMQLSKCRLTALIACTAVSGLVMSPAFTSAPLSLLGTCVAGTALLSASASTCNNVIERQYDSQMRRTKSRVLPIGRLTPIHALSFAAASGTVGLGLLCLGCNHLTSGLGFLNLALYAGFYTPMKRWHHSCTWVGAVVGAIPPLMGYAAATGHLDSAALVLGALLFSWQFPHFNALSWNLREDYARAGYKMMCVTDQGLCRRTTLRHSLSLLLLCSVAAPATQLTTWTFSLTSVPLNAAMLFLAWRFYTNPNKESARSLFRYTLAYLPALMVLLYATKDENPKRQDKVVVSVKECKRVIGRAFARIELISSPQQQQMETIRD